MTININTVAKKAGVATSTVSLVLRNKPRVAQATRDAVMAAVEELGYVKAPPGRPKKKPGDPITAKRTNRIALLVPDTTPSQLYAPVYMDVLKGVEDTLFDLRKTMILRHRMGSHTNSRRPSPLFPSRVDGVLLFGETHDDSLIEQLNEIPVVQLMHAARPGERWDRVTYDNSKIGKIAAKYALSKGHTCCVFLGRICTHEDHFLQQRGLDFKAAMVAQKGQTHLLIKDLLIVSPEIHAINREPIETAVDEILAMKPRPTAIFTEADMVAAALYPALLARNIVPGRDIEIISCNNELPLLAPLQPRPVTIDIHAAEVGRIAVERLLWRIEQDPAPRPETILIKPTLVSPMVDEA